MLVTPKLTPTVEIYISYLDNPKPGEPVDLYAYTENVGENVTYRWFVNGVEVQGVNDPFITVNYDPNTIIKVVVLCNADCLTDNVAEAYFQFSAAPKQGDINGDGQIDSIDLNILISNYGKSGDAISDRRADLNGDNQVDSIDLNLLISNYGK